MLRTTEHTSAATSVLSRPTTEMSAQRLYQEVKKSILDGELKPGDRILSARQLQEKFGVSYRATLLALDRLKREDLIVRRRGAGTYVKGSAEPIPAHCRGKTLRVVLSIRDDDMQFLRPLADGIKVQLQELGVAHTVVRPPERLINRHADDAKEFLVPGAADAFIWVRALGLELPSIDVPLVIVRHDLEGMGGKWTGYDVVTSDARQSGFVAGAYLRTQGCSRVVIVGAGCEPRRMSPWTYLRVMGFQEGYGEEIPESRVFLAAAHTPLEAAKVIPQILKMTPLPDAIFADTDDLAYGLCHALVAHSIEPGKDIKVIGCDGQPPPYPEDPPLTTVAAPMEELGRMAAILGVQRAGNPEAPARRVLLACSLRKGTTA